MNIILLENIPGLGQLGDEVKVKPGYGRNFLIPQKKATLANAANRRYFAQKRGEYEKLAAQKLDVAEKKAAALQEVQLIIAARASEEGKLYGSISSADLAKKLVSMGHEVHRREILLADGAFHHIGDFQVNIRVDGQVTTSLNLSIIPE